MKTPAVIMLVITVMACTSKKQQTDSNAAKDSTMVLYDTVIAPHIPDSLSLALEAKRVLDSFNAAKPVAVFKSDENGEDFQKMIAALIDTTGFIQVPITFSDTIIAKYDKDENPVTSKQVCRSRRFVVEVLSPEAYSYGRRRLFINGRELRPGIEISEPVAADTFYRDNIEIDPGGCRLLRFGAKEYLLLKGHVFNCSGTACGVNYALIYDPLVHKAVLFEQFRSDFVVGYDRKNNTPVFITMNTAYNHRLQSIITSGSLFCFDRAGKIRPVLDEKGKPCSFEACYRDIDSSITLIESNVRINK